MDHAGHRKRLRQRYKQEGLTGFSSYEVLELLLTYAIPRLNTNDLAHRLIDRFGSFRAVLEASPAELEQVEGIGPQASTLLSMMLPMLRRYEQERSTPRPKLGAYAALSAYCRSLFLGVNVEHCYVLCFDAKSNLIVAVRLSQGTPSEVIIHPRAVVQEVIRHNATGVVLCHNHPGGSPEPSQSDLDVTKEIRQVLDGIGVRLYDHMIVSGSQEYSFHNHGLL